MNTGNTSKSALSAARIALLAGVSAAALGFSGSAFAQGTQIDSGATPVAVTGLVQTYNTTGNVAGTYQGSLFANTSGVANTTITGASITSTDNVGGSTNINGGYVTITGGSNTNAGGTVSTLTLGNASTAISGGAYVSNGLAVTGGTNITGGTTTDTLKVTGATTTNGITNTGNIKTGSLTDTGNASVGGTATVTGQSFLNGGATVSGNLTATPGTNVNMGDNVVHDVATPIVGTDAANKAYVDKQTNRAFEGTAVALAISQPMFQPGQSFAVRAGWGDYESQNAFGVSAAGIVAHDIFGYGSTVTVDAGVGVGTNYNGVAGKAGVTIGFGGVAPLK